MSTAPRCLPYYAVEDCEHWEGDWELVDGIAVSMTPSPFAPQIWVVAGLSRQILNQFLEYNCDYPADSNRDSIVADDS